MSEAGYRRGERPRSRVHSAIAACNRAAIVPLVFRVADDEGQSRSIRDCRTVRRRRHDGNAGAPLKLGFDEPADGWLDLCLLIELRPGRSLTTFFNVAWW